MADFNFLNSPSFGALGGIAQSAQIDETRARTADTQMQTAERAASIPRLQAETAALQDSQREKASFAQLLSTFGKSDPKMPMSDRFAQLGQAALTSSPVQAMEMLKLSTQARGNEVAQELKQTEAAKRVLDTHKEAVSQIGGMFNMVRNAPPEQQQQVYDAVIARARQDPSLRNEVANLPTKVADAMPMLQVIVGESISAKDQVSQVERALADKNRDDVAALRAQVAQTMATVAQQRADSYQQRTDRLEAEGGKRPAAASPSDLKNTRAAIYQQLIGTDAPSKQDIQANPAMAAIDSQVQLGVNEISALAKKQARETGVTFDTAVSQIIAKQKASGDWDLHRTAAKAGILGFGSDPGGKVDKAQYKGGVTKETATPLPMAGGKPDRSSMVPGHYYVLPNGDIKPWDGK